MRTIVLDARPLSAAVLAFLERKKLVRALRPTAKILRTRTKTGAVETFYSTAPRFGTHKLMGIGKRTTEIRLSCHADNEEFLLINPARAEYKPLYLVVALDKRAAFERKAAKNRLTAKDFLAVECVFNDPATCVFTLLKGTVHCEITRPGKGQHPVFFVAEPSRMGSTVCRTPGTRIAVAAA